MNTAPDLISTLRARPGWRVALLLLALAGLVGPWWFNLAWFAAGGSLAPGVFFPAVAANALTTAITIDVYLAAVAFGIAVAADEAGGRARWWALPLCFGIGLAVALPGYLWWRSRPAPGHAAPRRVG